MARAGSWPCEYPEDQLTRQLPEELPPRPTDDVADIWASDLVYEMSTCDYLISALLLMFKHSFCNPNFGGYAHPVRHRLDEHYDSYLKFHFLGMPCPDRSTENEDIVAAIDHGICQTIELCRQRNAIEAVGFAKTAFTCMLDHNNQIDSGYEMPTLRRGRSETVCQFTATDMIRWLLFNEDVFGAP